MLGHKFEQRRLRDLEPLGYCAAGEGRIAQHAADFGQLFDRQPGRATGAHAALERLRHLAAQLRPAMGFIGTDQRKGGIGVIGRNGQRGRGEVDRHTRFEQIEQHPVERRRLQRQQLQRIERQMVARFAVRDQHIPGLGRPICQQGILDNDLVESQLRKGGFLRLFVRFRAKRGNVQAGFWHGHQLADKGYRAQILAKLDAASASSFMRDIGGSVPGGLQTHILKIRLSTNKRFSRGLEAMVLNTCRQGPAIAPVPRMRGMRVADKGRLSVTFCVALVGVRISAPALAQAKASLVIETYTAAPIPAAAVAPAVSRLLEAHPVTGSKTVLHAAYTLFAQMGDAGQSSASGQSAARKAMELVYDRAVLTAPGEGMACGGIGYRPSGMLSADNEETRRVLYPLVWREACRAGVPAGLLDALIIHESRYRVDAVSPKGAIGLTQLMPGTAANLGVNSWSIEDNVRGGARYLHSMLASFGQYHLALAAYNAGPSAVVRSGGVPAYRETQTYVGDIIRRWSALAGN